MQKSKAEEVAAIHNQKGKAIGKLLVSDKTIIHLEVRKSLICRTANIS